MHCVEEGVRSNVDVILDTILHPTSREETTHTFPCTAKKWGLIDNELVLYVRV
jgi:hypothetical protein